jgi:hypothetical protein
MEVPLFARQLFAGGFRGVFPLALEGWMGTFNLALAGFFHPGFGAVYCARFLS